MQKYGFPNQQPNSTRSSFDWASSVVTGDKSKELMMGSSLNSDGVTRNESIRSQRGPYLGYNNSSSQLATSLERSSSNQTVPSFPLQNANISNNTYTNSLYPLQQPPLSSSYGIGSSIFGNSTNRRASEQPSDGGRFSQPLSSTYTYRNVSTPLSMPPAHVQSLNSTYSLSSLSGNSGPRSTDGLIRKRPSDLVTPMVVNDRGLSTYTNRELGYNISVNNSPQNRANSMGGSSHHPNRSDSYRYNDDNGTLNRRYSPNSGDSQRISSEDRSINRVSSLVGSRDANNFNSGNSSRKPTAIFNSQDYKANIGGPISTPRTLSTLTPTRSTNHTGVGDTSISLTENVIEQHNNRSTRSLQEITALFPETRSLSGERTTKDEPVTSTERHSVTNLSGPYNSLRENDSDNLNRLSSPVAKTPNNSVRFPQQDMNRTHLLMTHTPKRDIPHKMVITPQRRGVSRAQSIMSEGVFSNTGHLSKLGSQISPSIRAQKDDEYIKKEQRCLKTITELEHELRRKNNEVLQLRLALNRHCVSAMTMAKFAAKSMISPRASEMRNNDHDGNYGPKDSLVSTPRRHTSIATSLPPPGVEVPLGGQAVAPPHVAGLPLAPIPFHRPSKGASQIIGAGNGSLHASSFLASTKKVMCGSVWILEEGSAIYRKDNERKKQRRRGSNSGSEKSTSIFSRMCSGGASNDTVSDDENYKDTEKIDNQIIKYRTAISRGKWMLRYIVADDRGVTIYHDQSDFMSLSYHRAIRHCPYQTFELFVPRFSNQKNALDDEDHKAEVGVGLSGEVSRDCAPMYHIEADDLIGIHFGFVALQPVGSKKSRPLNPPFLLRLTSSQEYEDWSHFFAMQFNRRLYRESFPMLFIGVMDGETVITVSEGTNTDNSLFAVREYNMNETPTDPFHYSGAELNTFNDQEDGEMVKKNGALDLAKCMKSLVLETSKASQTETGDCCDISERRVTQMLNEINENELQIEDLTYTSKIQEEIIDMMKHLIRGQYLEHVNDVNNNDNVKGDDNLITADESRRVSNISAISTDFSSKAGDGVEKSMLNNITDCQGEESERISLEGVVSANDLVDKIDTPEIKENTDRTETDRAHNVMLKTVLDKTNKELEIATEGLIALTQKQAEQRKNKNSEDKKLQSVTPTHSQLIIHGVDKGLQVGGPARSNHSNSSKKSETRNSSMEPYLPFSSCLSNRVNHHSQMSHNPSSSKLTKSNVNIKNNKYHQYQSDCENCSDIIEEMEEVREENGSLRTMLQKQQKTYEDKVRQLCDRAAQDIKGVMKAANKSILRAAASQVSEDRSLTHNSRGRREHIDINGDPVIEAISLCIRRVVDKATMGPYHDTSSEYPDSFDVICEMDPRSMTLVASNRIDTTYNTQHPNNIKTDAGPRQVRHGWAFKDLVPDSEALIVVDVQCFPDGLDLNRRKQLFATNEHQVWSMGEHESDIQDVRKSDRMSEPLCPPTSPPKVALRRLGLNISNSAPKSSLEQGRSFDNKDKMGGQHSYHLKSLKKANNAHSTKSKTNEMSVSLAPLSASTLDMRRMLAIPPAVPVRTNRSSVLRSEVGSGTRHMTDSNAYPPTGVSVKPFMSPRTAITGKKAPRDYDGNSMTSNDSSKRTPNVSYQHQYPFNFAEVMRRVKNIPVPHLDHNGIPMKDDQDYDEENEEMQDTVLNCSSSTKSDIYIGDSGSEKNNNHTYNTTNIDVECSEGFNQNHIDTYTTVMFPDFTRQLPRGMSSVNTPVDTYITQTPTYRSRSATSGENDNNKGRDNTPEVYELIRESSGEMGRISPGVSGY